MSNVSISDYQDTIPIETEHSCNLVKENLTRLINQVTALKEKLLLTKAQLKVSKSETKGLFKKIESLKEKKYKEIENKVRESLPGIFSQNQMDIYLKKKKGKVELK